MPIARHLQYMVKNADLRAEIPNRLVGMTKTIIQAKFCHDCDILLMVQFNMDVEHFDIHK